MNLFPDRPPYTQTLARLLRNITKQPLNKGTSDACRKHKSIIAKRKGKGKRATAVAIIFQYWNPSTFNEYSRSSSHFIIPLFVIVVIKC
uniref:Uncharacterized protein n=1 Tax=Pristionchus pacificus TaxID=54126 RepID=A0A2A6C0A1_PRIPA|eukprot:PDM71539.1 hypothetical protein PRIPAC_37946 [Pristionchus pacificus]